MQWNKYKTKATQERFKLGFKAIVDCRESMRQS